MEVRDSSPALPNQENRWFNRVGSRGHHLPPMPPDGDLMAVLVRKVIDHMAYGVIVLDSTWHVPFANRAAICECANLGVMSIERGDLVVASLADRKRLGRAVEAARTGRWSLALLGCGTNLLTIAALPLHGDKAGGDAMVLLLFGLRNDSEALTIQLYANACALTPAETRVLRALAEGLAPQQIALRHEVLLSTVRTQLCSVRNKTGTRSINNLARALVSLPPVMPVSMGRENRCGSAKPIRVDHVPGEVEATQATELVG